MAKKIRRKSAGGGNQYGVKLSNELPLHYLKPVEFLNLLEGHHIERTGDRQARLASGVIWFFSDGQIVIKRKNAPISYSIRSTWAAWERAWVYAAAPEWSPLLAGEIIPQQEAAHRTRQFELERDCQQRHWTGRNQIRYVTDEQRAEVQNALKPA